MDFKRLTLFMGHYGSGKTFTAVNYSLMIRKKNFEVSIYDLDIVNPYFRAVDAKDVLKKNGVELVVSPFAETNVDIPAMNAESYKMLELNRYAVIDVGGDDRGALALGRFSKGIKEENNYDSLFVINMYRPETSDVKGVLEIKKEIESVSNISFTALVNNTNLGFETSVDDIYKGLDFCKEIEKETGLGVKFSSIRKDLIEKLDYGKIEKDKILPIEPIKYGNWL